MDDGRVVSAVRNGHMVEVRFADGRGGTLHESDPRVGGSGLLPVLAPSAPLDYSRGWTATKRDGRGNVISTPMGQDSYGRYRPVRTVATECRMCGRPNYSAEYSTCERCNRG